MKTTICSIIALTFSLLSFGKADNTVNTDNGFFEIPVINQASSTTAIINEYLKIKNALVKSDSKNAALSAEALTKSIDAVAVEDLPAPQKASWSEITEKAKKAAKSIVAANGKLDKQRKAFHELSQSISELITGFGTTQKLYLDFCPMYDDGSVWISETKNIKNPYYGAQMMSCGTIRKTFE